MAETEPLSFFVKLDGSSGPMCRASDEANNVLYTCCDIRRDLIRSYLQDAKQTQLSATITHWDYNAIDPVRHKYFSLVRIYLIGKTA